MTETLDYEVSKPATYGGVRTITVERPFNSKMDNADYRKVILERGKDSKGWNVSLVDSAIIKMGFPVDIKQYVANNLSLSQAKLMAIELIQQGVRLDKGKPVYNRYTNFLMDWAGLKYEGAIK